MFLDCVLEFLGFEKDFVAEKGFHTLIVGFRTCTKSSLFISHPCEKDFRHFAPPAK